MLPSGSYLPYHGEIKSVDARPAGRKEAELISGPVGFVLRANTEDEARSAAKAWYTERALEHLPGLVDDWKQKLGIIKPHNLLIAENKIWWGSTSPDGTLRFNWKCMFLNEELVSYIILHETAHLKDPSHSKGYWTIVEESMPDMRRREAELYHAELKLLDFLAW